MAHGRTIFNTNIFLKFGNLYLTSEHVSPQRKVEYILIFHIISLQDQKLKSRNNPILYAFKNILNKNINEIYISLFQKPIVVEGWLKLYCSRGVVEIILWWRGDRDYIVVGEIVMTDNKTWGNFTFMA